MSLRTAVLGAGIVTKNSHLPSVSRNIRTALVAVCDADKSRAREAAATYDANPYTDVEALLAEEKLDWLHIATPVQTTTTSQ